MDKKPYPPRDDYGMDKKPYPPRDNYGKDSYDKKPYGNDDYGKDSYDKKPYESKYGNSYGQDYPSYKPVYGKDPYGKDRDYDKSKDSNSVSIKKIKCNNINLNLNSIDVSVGNPPTGAANSANGGALPGQDDQSVAASGLMNDGRDGKKVIVDKENNFAFICINNNNNVGAGNQTEPEEDECDECFAALNASAPRIFVSVEDEIAGGITIDDFVFEGGSIEEFCQNLTAFVDLNGPLSVNVFDVLDIINDIPDLSTSELNAIINFIECLVRAGLITLDAPIDVATLQNTLAAVQ
jgi:hypothetical protein